MNIKVERKADENTRMPRQLNPGLWPPVPSVWGPNPRLPLNTWWASPWPYNNGQSLVRLQPPSPYWHDYYGHDHHKFEHHEHDHHHHDHHDHHHGKPQHHHHHHPYQA